MQTPEKDIGCLLLPLASFRMGLLLTKKCLWAVQACQGVLGIQCLYPPPTTLWYMQTCLVFYVGAGKFNSDTHDCPQPLLPTKPGGHHFAMVSACFLPPTYYLGSRNAPP